MPVMVTPPTEGEAQPLLLSVQVPRSPARGHSASSTPRRGRLLSFEAGFPSIVDDEDDDDAADETPRRPWLSISVLLTLLMSAIGAGTLSVPYTLLLLSPAQAVAAMLGVGLAMAFTADTILRVHVAVVAGADEDQSIHETYQELAYHAGGERLARFVSFLAGFAVFGACVGCVRVVQDMTPALLSMLYLARAGAQDEQRALVSATVWLIFLAVVLPLGFFKKISVLRYSSYVGFGCCLCLVGAVAYRSVGGSLSETEPAAGGLAPIEIHESWLSRLSVAIGIYNFTYMLHLNVIPLFPQVLASFPSTQRDRLSRAQRRMSRQIYAAVGICAGLYGVFGVCAAAIYGPRTQGNILLNLAHDPIMAVPRVVMLVTIVLSYPLLFHPLRRLVLELRGGGYDHDPGTPTLVAVSVLLTVAQLLVATRVPGIQVVFSFVGSSILLVLCYLLPGVFYARLCPWRRSRGGHVRMALHVALGALATVFCTMATVKLVRA